MAVEDFDGPVLEDNGPDGPVLEENDEDDDVVLEDNDDDGDNVVLEDNEDLHDDGPELEENMEPTHASDDSWDDCDAPMSAGVVAQLSPQASPRLATGKGQTQGRC
eukprot:5925512-Prymnesium_polylepis.1